MTEFEKQIEDVAVRLPQLPPQRKKNIYDILGVQTKETINSRVLAYFLDATEEHKFNMLFFDALKELIEEKKHNGTPVDFDRFNGAFKVITEDKTIRATNEEEKQKRIDISIEGNDWCILIENKINHSIDNPLQAYWEHAQAKFPDNVIGIILTIPKISRNECEVNDTIKYINITHKELIRRVQKNLIIGTKTNDLNLFYLKEYIKNIESHYKQKTDEPKMNNLVTAITNQREEIKTIKNKLETSLNFIEEQTVQVFESFGFEKTGNWYVNRELPYDLYFYMRPAEENILNEDLWFCFELRNETNSQYREHIKETDFKEAFKKVGGGNLQVSGNKKSKNQTHIAVYFQKGLHLSKQSFKDTLTNSLSTHFMGENGIVAKTIAFLDQQFKVKKEN